MTTSDAQYIISKLTASPFSLKIDIIKLSAYTPEQLTALILRVIERLAPPLTPSTPLHDALATLKYPHPSPPPTRDALLSILRWLFLQHDTNPTLLATRAFIGEHLAVPDIPEGFMGYADVAAGMDELNEAQGQFVALHKRVAELEEQERAWSGSKLEQESAQTQKERLEDKLAALRAKVAELPDATDDLHAICAQIATQRMRAAHMASQLAEQQKLLTHAREQQRDLAQGVQQAAALVEGDVVHALTTTAQAQRNELQDKLERVLPEQRVVLEQRLQVVTELLGKSAEQVGVETAKRRAELVQLQRDVEGILMSSGGGGGGSAGEEGSVGSEEEGLAIAQAAATTAARAREEATLRVERLHTRMGNVIQSLESALQASPAAMRTVQAQLLHLTTTCNTRHTAVQQEVSELQQDITRLEASLHTKHPSGKTPTPTTAAPVTAQAVDTLLKQSKALRMRVQEMEAQHDAAKKKHAATTLLWEGRTRGLQTQVDALSSQAALVHTRDELGTQLVLATEQAQRVQQEEEYTALQASLTTRLGSCDADVRRLQEQLGLMKQVDEDVQRQYTLARSLQTMLEAKQAWLARGEDMVEAGGENVLVL